MSLRIQLLLLVSMIGSLAFVITPSRACAHGRSVSYSNWELDGNHAEVRVRIARLELTRLGRDIARSRVDGQAIGAYLSSHLRLDAGGVPCSIVSGSHPARVRDGWIAFRWAFTCSSARPLTIRSTILLDEAPGHLHFARVQHAVSSLPEGTANPILERVLFRGNTRFELGAPQNEASNSTSGSTLGDYIALGVEHILSGWDHLAFVIALLLLAGSLGEVARLITGFTLAHSVTLGLAVLGVLHPEAGPVEAMIGFSVALVALENGWELSGRDIRVPGLIAFALLVLALLALCGIGTLSAISVMGLALFTVCHFGLMTKVERPARLRILLVFGFGLVHGFGFAAVLEEMALPTHRLAPALFGFNLGVEVGQLGVILVAWPLLRGLARVRGGTLHAHVRVWVSAGVAGVGIYWFLVRALG